jgi:HipA-like protein
MAGVSERFVRFVEQGKPSLRLDTLLALLDTLGLELQLATRTSAAARALVTQPLASQPLAAQPLGTLTAVGRPAGRPRAQRRGEPAVRHRIADVYKRGVLAARLERHDGGTRFSYLPAYIQSGRPAVASSLPLSPEPVLSGAGAAPPYFTGLLPEGRRLNALRRSIKTSADDDLSLLIAAGGNPVGDVQIVGHGEPLDPEEHAVEVDPRRPVDFDELLGDSGLIDPVALAGVQDKLSAGMISMPVASAGRRFILKLNAPGVPARGGERVHHVPLRGEAADSAEPGAADARRRRPSGIAGGTVRPRAAGSRDGTRCGRQGRTRCSASPSRTARRC